MARNGAYMLLLAVLALISLGLVVLTSVSAYAPANGGHAMYFVTRQAMFLGIGVVACIAMSRWDYHQWSRRSWVLLLVGLLLMAACFVPHIGVKVKGAHRWMNIGFTRIQPVEIAKFALVGTMAWWFAVKARHVEAFRDGVFIPLIVLGFTLVFCVAQQDLGTSALLIMIVVLLMYIAGAPGRYVLPIPLLGFAAILGIAWTIPQRVKRLTAFMDPEAHKSDGAWQLWNALLAFGSGGLSGRGLGEGVQKMYYLPEAHTDFIFPNIGEELGLVFTLLVVLCFLVIALTGGSIACHAPDKLGVLIGTGVTALICLQAMMNMAVVTALMPTKGIGLPFISYGGSNLVMCMGLIGILLNIHRQALYAPKKKRGVLPPVVTAGL